MILTLRGDEQDACSTGEERRFSAAIKGKRVEQAFQACVKEAPQSKPGCVERTPPSAAFDVDLDLARRTHDE
ncbi:MAG: hypothetical protein WA646_19060, partial [Candidatus Sulfotelmatobacter sp.]